MFSKKSRKTRTEFQASNWSQVRRCHKCDAVHECAGDRVEKCADCGAHFAPYFYAEYTPNSLGRGAADSLVLSSPKKYRPLVGFSWWWSDSAKAGETIMPRA